MRGVQDRIVRQIGVSHFAQIGVSEIRFYRYLRDSGPLCMSLESAGEQMLSLFVWCSPSLYTSREALRADFVNIYAVPALVVRLRRALN